MLIDDKVCSIISQSDTEIQCETAPRPWTGEEPTFNIFIDGKGFVATQGLLYRYVQLWSDYATWGGDIPPQEGEAVTIGTGRHLLVDVDSTPVLSFIVVEGSLIFAPNENDEDHVRNFDAYYIMVNGGYVEMGTEDFPYTSNLIITMHGNVRDPYLPTYGNKVLAVRYGTLEMHGRPRLTTWSTLESTVEPSDTSITLHYDESGTELDWKVGEWIVIASTDYESRHAEKRQIESISSRALNPVITFTEPLAYKHYGGVETYGTQTLEMRAEVGLLSRNVIYRGDPETSADNQYGAHIMLHSPGDESSVGRIENCEFTDVGQAFKLGRYPIHFHMIGTVNKSYIKNNAIHETYNRAITIHGVHYLQIVNNVAYKTMGHTIFIEDAAETKNFIDSNLVVDTRASFSLLNTDSTPASFWITHPDNIFRNNHAAGSDRYGFWFDLQEHSIGPSADVNICPENDKLGEFTDNWTHSNGRYGLRIFHNLIPRVNPCGSFSADESNPSDPYAANPPIIAEFHNLVSYKNNRNGAIAERLGAVQFHNFKTADNILAGMEYSLTENIIDGYAKIIGGLVVGRSANTESDLDAASPHGIIGPRTENFTIEGTQFFNFDWNDAAALGTCSHCFHPAATDSGARTVTVSGLEFTDVSRKILYQYPERGIFHDLDGSLTGLGADTYASANFLHNSEQPECTLDEDQFHGVICDNTVQIRRVVFYDYAPEHFKNMELRVLPFERQDV